MAFDTEQFFKYGILPAAETLRDYMGYNWERKLALQRHLQTMAETQYQYNRRAQEQQKAHEYDVDLHEKNVEFEGYKDLLQRNRIDIQARANVWEAGEKAGISIKRTAAEEDIRLMGKMKGYDALVKSLSELYGKDSAKGDEISINSLAKSADALEKFQAMEDDTLQKIRNINKDIATSEDEKTRKEYLGTLGKYQERLKTINDYRKTLDKQVLFFKMMGVTQDGVIPQDKQIYLLEALEYLRKISPEDIGKLETGEIMGGINAVLGRVMPGLEITEGDSEFILLHALSSIKKSLQK